MAQNAGVRPSTVSREPRTAGREQPENKPVTMRDFEMIRPLPKTRAGPAAAVAGGDGGAAQTRAGNAAANRAAAGNKPLDQFYTKPEVAGRCMAHLQRAAKRLRVDLGDYWFVEPSAGCGCFHQILPPRRRIGIDLDPKTTPLTKRAVTDSIEQADYLAWAPPKTRRARKYLVVGNPPFGHRGKLAVAFFNHSAFAEIIAFIVPVSFRKYAMHRRLAGEYRLIARAPLPRDSFCTPDLKTYSVNAEFQIWTRLPNRLKNLRELSPPPIAHEDFTMRQYNNTEAALKEFHAPFDFAVPCQGYQNYARRETKARDCEKNKQWMLFTARTAAARRRLMAMDFGELALDCATATPGFRKNDVVRHYDSLVVRSHRQ